MQSKLPMAQQPAIASYKHFNLTYPVPYVAHVEINRPDKMNAFIEAMWLEIAQIFNFLSTDPHTRAIILSGAGPRAFTTGLDVAAASSTSILSPSYTYQTQSPSSSPTPPPMDPARIATHMRHHITAFQSCISAIAACSKPVLAALHGFCYGLGIDIALCADVRICTPSTRFAVKEVDIGLAADIGTLSRISKVVGSGSWIRDICLSAREFPGAEAKEFGLVSWVGGEEDTGGMKKGDGGKEEMMKEALRWAKLVGEKSPVAVQGTKEILEWSRDRSVEDGLRYTAVWNSVALQTADVAEAMNKGLQRKKANFAKL